jgi:uncharacterized membrane protein
MDQEVKDPKAKNHLLTGLFITLPAVLTIWILWLIFKFVGAIFFPILRVLHVFKFIPDFFIIILSSILTVGLIWFVGVIGNNFLVKKIFRFMEQNILLRIPMAKNIYPSIRQLTDAVVGKKKFAFKKVVLIEYPRKGIYTVAFVTNEVENTTKGLPRGKMLHVLVPTTPNPTTGWFAIVPEEDAISLPLSVEEGLKLVISGGIVASPVREELGEENKINVNEQGRIND